MGRNQKILDFRDLSDLPDDYQNLSIIEDGDFFVNKSNRHIFACLLVESDNKKDEVIVVVNIKTKNKLAYKKYITIANALQNTTTTLARCFNPNIISSIYAGSDDSIRIDEKLESDTIDTVNALISEALFKNVSDIHLEIREVESRIRFRLNGNLSVHSNISFEQGERLGLVLYQALATEAGVVFNPLIPQDAMVDSVFNGVRARLRIATAPASPNGFDMVIRLLKFAEKSSYTRLEDLGYLKSQADMIYSFTTNPVGVIIVAGTTGSGKSTTLKNLITKKIIDHNSKIKVITVEDPPEYEIKNATQIPVIRDDSGSAEAGFSGAIRTAMRSDPDVLMIGEVRDSQSASLLVSATQSGHQVFSTLHAPSAVGIIPRLESLGVSRDIISSSDFISGLIYQKLLPKICDACAIMHTQSDGESISIISEESIILKNVLATKSQVLKAQKYGGGTISVSRALQDLGYFNEDQVIEVQSEYKQKVKEFNASGFEDRLISALKGDIAMVRHAGPGCSKCNGSGIIGRLVVAELLVPDDNILQAIKNGNDMETLKAWRESDFGDSILQSSIRLIRNGIVDPLHVESELGRLHA